MKLPLPDHTHGTLVKIKRTIKINKHMKQCSASVVSKIHCNDYNHKDRQQCPLRMWKNWNPHKIVQLLWRTMSVF